MGDQEGNVTNKIDLNPARQKQIKLLGSEPIYDRVSMKLAALQVESFFQQEQDRVLSWRHNLLQKNWQSYRDMTQDEKAFVITQNFDQVANWILLDSQSSPPNIKIDPKIGKEAALKFWAQNLLFNLLTHLHYDQAEVCKCYTCERSICTMRSILARYPGAVDLLAKGVRMAPYLFKPNLKEMCMKKVLEMRLEVEWLPQTLKQELMNGPEPRNWKKELQDRMLEQLHKIASVTNSEQDTMMCWDVDQY